MTVRTFFPRTVVGVQNIVRNASSVGARVRASATRHTFNPWLWGVESGVQPGTEGHNTDYIVSMVPLSVSDKLANKRDHGSWPGDTELVNIQGPLNTWLGQDGRTHAAVRQCSPLSLVQIQPGSALIGPELHSVATPYLMP